MNSKTPDRPATASPLDKPRRGRPRADGRQRQDTRQALIRVGTALLTEKGFGNTGIDQILKQAGVPKGSFYHYFASKDEFGRAVIDGYAAYFAKRLDRCLLNESRSPLQRLQDFVEEGKAGLVRHDFKRGCLIGNMGQELAGNHDEFRLALEAVIVDWQSRFEACLMAARQTGEIAEQADCARLSAFFWIGWEGAVLRAKLMRSPEPVDLFAETFFSLCQPTSHKPKTEGHTP